MAERKLISFDYAVKYLLRGKDDYGILNGFLSELMGRQVTVENILESETNKVDPDEKTNRVDLKAQIDGGELAVFEIQFSQETDFFGRVLYGVSRALTEQVGSGNLYNIKKVYSINIIRYNLTAKREYMFHGKFSGFRGVHFEDEVIPFAQVTDKDSEKLVEIHPEYYLILPKKFDETLRSRFDEWVYMLKNSKVRDDFTAAGIKEAKVKLDYMSMSPEERVRYERYMDITRSENSIAIAAERKGKAEGKAEGIAETQREIVQNMHDAGLGVDEIVRISKISESEVKNILNS